MFSGGLDGRITNPDAKGAMTDVMRSHGPQILAAVQRLVADPDQARDAFQEGMLAAWKSLPGYQGRSTLSTWVHRVVINHALMLLRRRGRTHEQSLDDLLPSFTGYGHYLSSPPEWCEEPGTLLQREEVRSEVRQCVERLPDTYRVPLVLRDLEGMRMEEIAKLLEITVNAVKIRVHRARQALKSMLEPCLLEGAK
jgi:RNA polymerase sigma-70 factor (ECF subfamily)